STLSPPPTSTLFPYTTLFRSGEQRGVDAADERLPAPIEANDGAAIADRENVGRRRAGQRPQGCGDAGGERPPSRRLEAIRGAARDRKSTRLNSSHDQISYAVF